jgi:hypothetical protein
VKPTWYRASGTIWSQNERPGTLTAFFDYDLLDWTFGLRGESDPQWYGLTLQCGPLRLSFDYWRQDAAVSN